ncbi:MAG: phosphoribosylglycinamide formyltransferase [Flavobacteriaceae bacterium]|nr:phosphoribosylglycinamide formyltransferase [Flavobacteriaceae bacterium]
MKHLVIFASGSGSNAENIANFFKFNNRVKIDLIATNKASAGVIARAKRLNIACKVFDKRDLINGDWQNWPHLLQADLIILAGFLLKIPADFIAKFPNKIINIHPALLPKYGGKGMYGDRVHQAVVDNNENESGITIHYVNENYDDGAVIFQKSFALDADETAELLAQKIHQLEYNYFPKVIDKLLFDDAK